MHPIAQPGVAMAELLPPRQALGRIFVIALMAFLTVADLFATQAILPTLTRAYGTTPAMMSLAVNASTLGMAVAGLALSLLGRRIPRRAGIVASLMILTIPTLVLSAMPELWLFALLRVLQGLCMATAFTLTLAHIGEANDPRTAASAFAAYIAGNVGSNLFGRLLSAAAADHLGLAGNFRVFAALNLVGVLVALMAIRPVTRRREAMEMEMADVFSAWLINARAPAMRAAFGLGFCILFAFIGTFTYVNFVLAVPPFGLGMMALGLVYFVFAPSVMTTPLAGRAVLRWGTRPVCFTALLVAASGLPLLLVPSLFAVMAGLVLLSAGTFFAQAIATGFVARHAPADRAAASGLYLGCYFLGGVVGSLGLGLTFDRLGWPACVTGIGLALLAGMGLTRWLDVRR
jgi:MFS transporter, YNFM family, putative membrane transport protein